MYRVVIIDDHPIVSLAVQSTLEAQGQFDVVATRDTGIAGLSAVREFLPDLVILDLGVPLLGGFEIISRLRADQVAVRILVLSSADESHAVRALRVGANGFVHKSSDLGEITIAALLTARGKLYFSHEVLEAARNHAKGSANVLDRLNQKEFEIFRKIVSGQSNVEIAKHMLLSNKTISAYRIKIMSKLGVSNIRELIELAKELDENAMPGA